MPRRLISVLVLLVLILQGVAQANAYLPESQMQEHCAGHDMSTGDCVCCTDAMMLSGGCASFCSAVAGIAVVAASVPRAVAGERVALALYPPPGPAYLPLNPPPIP